MKASEIKSKLIPWNGFPEIGWWLDNDPVTFYHGTHEKNLEVIFSSGLKAPKTGPTAGMISLALEPNTAWGYSSMTGGEASFRAAGAQAVHVPNEERVVFVLKIPQKYFLSIMAPARGQVAAQKDLLTDRSLYENWVKDHTDKKGRYNVAFDQQYYASTEIRLPNKISSKFIVGYTRKV